MWGGELLVADLATSDRAGHLRPVALPGGAAAVREPWRMAAAWLTAAVGPAAATERLTAIDARAGAVVDLATRPTTPTTTSAGRLFDAVAVLLGCRPRISYEAQAAIELEALARSVPRRQAPLHPGTVVVAGARLDPAPLLAALLEGREAGVAPPVLAAAFHETFGRAVAALAADLTGERGLDTVVLTGGVFQNARFSEVVADALATAGLRVLTHRAVPPNDGGISIGQAAVAAARRE
jgi:hydrogenase maturation protein HypF